MGRWRKIRGELLPDWDDHVSVPLLTPPFTASGPMACSAPKWCHEAAGAVAVGLTGVSVLVPRRRCA